MNHANELHPVEKRVHDFIRAHGLLNDNSKVIIGLSGGADSVALTSVLTTLGYKCIAAHCNYHLRGDESNRDESFVKRYTAALGIPLECTDFDVRSYISGLEKSASIEMACRDLRYEWFGKLRLKYGEDAVIAVAHNADDNIETLFLNILRGTGITGLRGMQPVNASGIVRPLLKIYRSEIESYLDNKGLEYVTDSTNLEVEFNRNKLRNLILPVIYRNFPNSRKGISSTIDIISETEEFYKAAIESYRGKYCIDESTCDLASLVNEVPQAHLLLFEWLKALGVTSSQVSDIISSAAQSGRRFSCSAGGYLLINRGKLHYVAASGNISHQIEDYFDIEIRPGNKITPDRSGMIAFFDADLLDPDSLYVRFWHKGDRIKPFGMKGSRKVSDIFSDAKISLEQKSRIPLLMYGEDILWVAGLRASRLFSVTDETRSYIAVRYNSF